MFSISYRNTFWVTAIALLYVLGGILTLLYQNYYFYLYCCIPFAIACFYLAIFHLDKFFFLIALVVPLSINIEDSAIRLGLSIPAEPLIVIATVLFIAKKIIENKESRKILFHPISIGIYLNLICIIVTTVTSEMPVVSMKFLLARIWFITVFYFLAIEVFQNLQKIKLFMWLAIATILIVIGYTVASHAQYGFHESKANAIMYPFYNDHTAYAAVLVMYLPFLVYNILKNKQSLLLRSVSVGLSAVFVFAIIVSYTRAAWVSLAAALSLVMILHLKVKFRYLIFLAILGVVYFIANSSEIMMKLEKNKQDTSEDFSKHLQSISNISSDASNVERINRWKCAIKMFLEKPVFGWGPGTYSFKYAPYQESKDKTIISTNFGTGGNAHSEYLGPLAESGVLGAGSFIILVITIFSFGFRLYYSTPDKETKSIVLVLFFALTTYLVHGCLNNFLDTDKASAPFWGFLAALVAIDINSKEEKKQIL